MSDASLTDKQMAIMNAIFRGNDDGSFLDIDQLMVKVGHTAKKQSMQCSLKFLERHGLVERELVKRRSARRRVVKPTPKAYLVLRGGKGTEDRDTTLLLSS